MRRLIAGAAAAAAVLAVSTPASAIVYGEPTAGDDFDNVVAIVGVLELAAGGSEAYLWCTGTLIDPDTVLSAAHCFPTWEEIASTMPPGFEGLSYAVAFAPDGSIPLLDERGLLGLLVDPTVLLGGQEFVHPDFPGPMSDLRDVAVFQLELPVTSITPASVAPPGYLQTEVARSDTFVTVGYGAVRDTRTKAWQSLQEADGARRVAEQPMLSLTRPWLTLSMNNARGHGGTCYGDSGGPHFHEGVLVSLTVTGDANCKATDKTYRVDTPLVHAFLGDYLTTDS